MSRWKHGLFAAFALVGISSTLLYTACEKDSCTDLKCFNGGSCADNFCRCPAGFEGAQCEIRQADRFLGKWGGLNRCDNSNNLLDTLTIFLSKSPNLVGLALLTQPGDTAYGTVNGREILFAEKSSGNYRETRQVVLSDKNLSYYIQRTQNVNNPGTKTVCTFESGTAKPGK